MAQRRGGRYGAAKKPAITKKPARRLPPRRTGSSKVTPNGSNPMAHGGNC